MEETNNVIYELNGKIEMKINKNPVTFDRIFFKAINGNLEVFFNKVSGILLNVIQTELKQTTEALKDLGELENTKIETEQEDEEPSGLYYMVSRHGRLEEISSIYHQNINLLFGVDNKEVILTSAIFKTLSMTDIIGIYEKHLGLILKILKK